MEALSHLYPLYKDGYGLTVTEIKDFMFSLAVSYDTELYNKDINTNLFDNYSEMTELCPSYRVVEKIHFSERLLKEVDFKIGEKWSDDYDVK